MIEIDEALEQVARHSQPLDPVTCELEHLAGHVLAETVCSDVDSPPFDKSMMDGFAVASSDIRQGRRELAIVARVTAGAEFSGTVQSGQAVQIMTGAPLPAGADAVVMVEQTTEVGDRVTIHAAEVPPAGNVMARGLAMKSGQAVMQAHTLIRSEDIGMLAEAGVVQCQVIRRPTLAVIATGDELVDARSQPTGSQIRNSNGPMLCSLARPRCSRVRNLGIAPDRPAPLAECIEQGLDSDVLVLGGGVSAGVADLVPGTLRESGVRQIFHKVKIKPGKPVWFGQRQTPDGGRTLVFGLPGNPVSAMVCFHVFVVPALLKLAGREATADHLTARLAVRHDQKAGRTTYWPCRLERQAGELTITPLDWKGSADLATLAAADGFGIFPGDRERFEPGETMQVFPLG